MFDKDISKTIEYIPEDEGMELLDGNDTESGSEMESDGENSDENTLVPQICNVFLSLCGSSQANCNKMGLIWRSAGLRVLGR